MTNYLIRSFLLIIFMVVNNCTYKNHNMNNDQEQIENSIFAIVKFSYNASGEMKLKGGICGTAFLINDSTALTANHVLNPTNFKPNDGFNNVQYWLLSRSGDIKIPLLKNYIESVEEIETRIIKLPRFVKCNLKVSGDSVNLKDAVCNFGHILGMLITAAHWNNNLLIIDQYKLDNYTSDSTGIVIKIFKPNINSDDINLNDITIIQPSFKGNVGMSGGPLIRDNEIVGMMSFGLPADSYNKESVFAISIDEILKRL